MALAQGEQTAEETAAAAAAAEAAAAEAQAAEDTAGAAYQAALDADTRSLDTAGKLEALATIMLHQQQQQAKAAAAAEAPPAGEGAAEGKAKDEPPKDLEKKAGRKKTWRERWEGA
jgi:hypothetical protein